MKRLLEKFLPRRERPAPKFTVEQFLTDKNLLGDFFGPSWEAWVAVAKAVFAEPLSKDELEHFCRLTGRESPPTIPVQELWAAVGRGGGKSRINSALAVYLATAFDWKSVLAAGESAVVMLLASDRTQARVLLNYVEAFFGSPLLAPLVANITAERLELKSGIAIEIHTSSYRSTRGRSLIAVLADELAFWKDESSINPDVEVIRAVRPGLARVPGSMLFAFSSPYRRSGALWQAHQKFYGKDGDKVLFVKAPTRDLNPTIDQQVVDDAIAEDPEAARSEWLAEFRSSSASFVSEDELQRATREDSGLPFRLYVPYCAAVDMSGGRNDQFALAIGHHEYDGTIEVDNVWAWPGRSSVETVIAEMGAILTEFSLNSVIGDKFGSELTRTLFSAAGIGYDWSERTTSDVYLETRVLFSTGRIRLPNNPRLINELRGLERKPGTAGKDRVDHPRGAHDDLAAAVAQVAYNSWQGSGLDMSIAQTFRSPHRYLDHEAREMLLEQQHSRWDGSLQ